MKSQAEERLWEWHFGDVWNFRRKFKDEDLSFLNVFDDRDTDQISLNLICARLDIRF